LATLESILAEVQILRQLVDDLPSRIEIASNQIVVISGLSDIDNRLGLVTAGEFRTGNGAIPGDGFTGVRIGYPAFTYGSSTWNIAGVSNDVIQFGLRTTDGAALAGAGNVLLDANGINITPNVSAGGYEGTRALNFAVGAALYASLWTGGAIGGEILTTLENYAVGSGTHTLLLSVAAPATDLAKALLQVESAGGAQAPLLRLRHDSNASPLSDARLAAADITLDDAASTPIPWLTLTAGQFVVNEDSADINFRVETNGDANMLFVDGGTDRIGIGTGTPSTVLHVLNSSPILRIEDTAASSGGGGGRLDLVSNDGAAVVANDMLGQLLWLGHDGISIVSGVRLRSHAGSTWSDINRESFVIIETTPSGSTTLTEAVRILSNQTLRLVSANSWTANGTGTVTISNLAPAGVGTATIAKWLTITDNAGVVMYIPAFT